MASVEQCEQALHSLSDRLDAYELDHGDAAKQPDRSMACILTDVNVSFTGRFHDGHLVDIGRSTVSDANGARIRVELASDDLIALVDGELDIAGAWLSGRVKIHAGMRDLMKLRSLF